VWNLNPNLLQPLILYLGYYLAGYHLWSYDSAQGGDG